MIEPPDDTRLVIIDEHGAAWVVRRDDAATKEWGPTEKTPLHRWHWGMDECCWEPYPKTFDEIQELGTLHYIGEKL